jgi:excisionase family DNA binding protein
MTATAPDLATLLTQLAHALTAQQQPAPTPRPMPERVLLTVEEAAERLGIGRTLMVRLVSTGEIESVKIGRLRRIHTSAIDEYAQRLIGRRSRGNVA